MFYSSGNRALIEEALNSGTLGGSQVSGCDLSELTVSGNRWDKTDLRDVHANGIVFEHAAITESVFFRSSLMQARFDNTDIHSSTFDALTLIKNTWHGVRVTDTAMKNLCLQRAEFSNGRFNSSSFVDFEAVAMWVDGCIFANCTIRIDYASGMNGFSGADITNCLFYRCRFEGFPLRGARVSSCVFSCCSGQPGDDMECNTVAGIGAKGRPGYKTLFDERTGRRLAQLHREAGA